MTTLAAIQSSYIPWKGYFDIINDVDIFVFYDDVQFTPRDWRSRNKIKGPSGAQWLTVPVGSKRSRLICEVPILDHSWQEKHYQAIRNYYSNCHYYSLYSWILDEIYRSETWHSLSVFNQHVIKLLSSHLGIQVEFKTSHEFELVGSKQTRMMDLIKKVKATTYVSGPSAADYLQSDFFEKNGVELKFKDYTGYPEHAQKYGPFDHGVTVLDLIFNVGPEAPYYIWGWRKQ